MIVKLDVHVEGADYVEYWDVNTTLKELQQVMAKDIKGENWEYDGKEWESINDWLESRGKLIKHKIDAVVSIDYATGDYTVAKGTKHDV
jgi:hypothetical protein